MVYLPDMNFFLCFVILCSLLFFDIVILCVTIFFCVLYCSLFVCCTVSVCDVRDATLTEVLSVLFPQL
jgi:hypothetical protein